MTAVATIRERLAAMAIVSCGLAHERAHWDNGCLVRRQLGDESILVRHLCSAGVRRSRLACAHTTARHGAEYALLELRDAGALTEDACAAFVQELHAIGHDIHLLDHRKGDAEKAYALAVETSRLAGDAAIDAARDEQALLVRALESEHHGQVERLRDWRDRVLAAVDRE